MARTVADQFAEALAAAGINRIYGIVGDYLNGLTDSLGFTLYMVKANLSGRGDEVVDLARTNCGAGGKLS
jgi:hypothetical protein